MGFSVDGLARRARPRLPQPVQRGPAQNAGPDIGFEIRTAKEFAQTSFPVSTIDPTSWHNLGSRYDGNTLMIFCHGWLMASQPVDGALMRNSEPLLIGAETDEGQVVRHLYGEMEESANWPRALTDAEVAALGR